MWKAHLQAWRGKIVEKQGEISLAAVIGCAILLAAYMTFPGAFHSFFQYLHETFIKQAHESFSGGWGGDPEHKPGKLAGGGNTK